MHHVKDVTLEPNLRMEFGESIQKTEGLSKCRDGSILSLVLDSKPSGESI